MSRVSSYSRSGPRPWKCLPTRANPARSDGQNEVGSGGTVFQQCPDCSREVVHPMPELTVAVGVCLREASQLSARLVGIVPAGQVRSVRQRRERAVERQEE